MEINKPGFVDRMIIRDFEIKLNPKDPQINNLGRYLQSKIDSVCLTFIGLMSSSYAAKREIIKNKIINYSNILFNLNSIKALKEKPNRETSVIRETINLVKNGFPIEKIRAQYAQKLAKLNPLEVRKPQIEEFSEEKNDVDADDVTDQDYNEADFKDLIDDDAEWENLQEQMKHPETNVSSDFSPEFYAELNALDSEESEAESFDESQFKDFAEDLIDDFQDVSDKEPPAAASKPVEVKEPSTAASKPVEIPINPIVQEPTRTQKTKPLVPQALLEKMSDSILSAWGSPDMESIILNDVWLTILNPQQGTGAKALVVKKWDLIEETKNSKKFQLEFEQGGTGSIQGAPGTLSMPKALQVEFTIYQGKKAINFPTEQLGQMLGVTTGYVKQIRVKDDNIEINAGKGKANGWGTKDVVKGHDFIKMMMSKITWK